MGTDRYPSTHYQKEKKRKKVKMKMSDDKEQMKNILLQELKDYKNSDNKFPELLKNYVKENVPNQRIAERFLKEFDDTYLKIMNLEELELLCSHILKKRNIKVK
ncbi:hypothetical protein POVCU1_011440 [Plasmodium ovale curtisi]|uniref:Uncharacterized protein n=2 Tax=Plasmodium ovale TaxID=36330 RepID=A0A1A8VZI9_PLAOA|nr:hypothetical protein POVCU1_011440 [Plasmodium ovale curtisi]